MHTICFVSGHLHFQIHRAKLEEGAPLEVFRLLRQSELQFGVAQLQNGMNVLCRNVGWVCVCERDMDIPAMWACYNGGRS